MPPLSDTLPGGDPEERETRLWRAFRLDGVPAAREALFDLHAAFARNIARRHYRERARGDIEFADLNQFACAALLEAIDRYDPERGSPFRSFAGPRISGSIVDGIGKMSELREQLSWKHRLRRERMQSLGVADADTGNTAQAMEALAELAVGLALGFMLEGTGLYAARDDEQSGTAPPTAYESLAWKDMVNVLAREVSELPHREQVILRHHYMGGIGFDHLAVLLNISRGRVSQLHRAALGLLRRRMTGKGHFGLEQ
jgi:RNA polymerase sigma factor for flagellar operon FliA